MDEKKEKKTPCANSSLKMDKCQRIVTTRGQILCNSCVKEKNKNGTLKRKEQEKIVFERLNSLEQKYESIRKKYKDDIGMYKSINNDLQDENTSLKKQLNISESKYKDHIENLSKEATSTKNIYNLEMKSVENRFLEEHEKLETENKILKLKIDEMAITTSSGAEDVKKKLIAQKSKYDQLFSVNEKLLDENEKLRKERKRSDYQESSSSKLLKTQIERLKKELIDLGKENDRLSKEKKIVEATSTKFYTEKKELEKIIDDMKNRSKSEKSQSSSERPRIKVSKKEKRKPKRPETRWK